MKIAICDDEAAVRKKTQELLSEAGMADELFVYEDADALLSEDVLRFDLILLDIGLHGTDGLEAARAIRKRQQDTLPLLVFLTGYSDYMKEAFSVHAFDYLVKPVCRDELFRLCAQAREVCERQTIRRRSTITVRTGGENVTVATAGIYYAESEKRKNILHLKAESIAYYGSIDELAERLSDSFFRIHKGYLVNMEYIVRYDRASVTMSNGDTLLISKYRYKAFVDAYMNFIRQG